MKKISVFEGNELRDSPPEIPKNSSRCHLVGKNITSDEAITLPLSDDLLSRHMLFLGGIGTGKTNAIFQLVSQLRDSMTSEDVMVVFDTKGDYYEQFYRQGDIVISNDEKATGEDGANYWNIFEEIEDEETREETVIEITRALFYEKSASSNQPFFPNAARDLLVGILLHFCRAGTKELTNNAQLRSFLDRSTSNEIRSILENYDDLKAMVSYIIDDRSPQTQGVISELQQLIREIFVGNFRKRGSLSMRKSIRQKGGKIIFVEYDLGIGGVLTPIYRLLLDLAIKEALGRKKTEGNVWFVIDEFRLIPSLQHVDDGINFGRSLGVKFIIGVQNVDQVFHSYGEGLARSILSGFMTTVAFRVNDTVTRDYVQLYFGKNRKHETFMATVQSRGIVEQVRDAFVVEDWDIARLPVGRAIVGLPGAEPFYLQFDPYNG